MTKENKNAIELLRVKKAVSILSGEKLREVLAKAVIDAINNDGFSIKLTAFNTAKNYLNALEEGSLKESYEESVDNKENSPTILEYFLDGEITGIIAFSENGEILAGFDPSRLGYIPLAEFIEDNREIFEAYNDDGTRAVYNEILAFYGE